MKNTKSGFTLPELLIVVAIIAVLVAIAIPVFSAQLEKSRDAVTVSNLRGAYAEAIDTMLTENKETVNGVQIAAKGQSGDLSGLDSELPFSVTAAAQRILGSGRGKICYLAFDFSDETNVVVDAGTAAYVGQRATEAIQENRASFNFYSYYTDGKIWDRSVDPAVHVEPDPNKIYFLANANDNVNKQGYYRFDGTNWYHADGNDDTWTVYTPRVGGNQIGG